MCIALFVTNLAFLALDDYSIVQADQVYFTPLGFPARSCENFQLTHYSSLVPHWFPSTLHSWDLLCSIEKVLVSVNNKRDGEQIWFNTKLLFLGYFDLTSFPRLVSLLSHIKYLVEVKEIMSWSMNKQLWGKRWQYLMTFTKSLFQFTLFHLSQT